MLYGDCRSTLKISGKKYSSINQTKSYLVVEIASNPVSNEDNLLNALF